jgi:hypothetical protein
MEYGSASAFSIGEWGGVKTTMSMEIPSERDRDNRRQKSRFPIQRELRYRVMQDGRIQEAGLGETVNMGSGGVAFVLEQKLAAGAFIELSISWPAQLENGTPMRLVIFGRVLRSAGGVSVCTVDKYEFRTQARSPQVTSGPRKEMMPRWFERAARQSSKLDAAALDYTAVRA